MRLLYALGFGYLALSLSMSAADWLASAPVPPLPILRQPPQQAAATSGAAWFRRMKSYCNPVEVATQVRARPAPDTAGGAAYEAACWALAGKIRQAAAVIDGMPEGKRHYAAGVLFAVGHPVADMGDDEAAGPIMRLVLEHQPENYMALYHAGISEYALGQNEAAREHLERFLALYGSDDGWRRNGIAVLERIKRGESQR